MLRRPPPGLVTGLGRPLQDTSYLPKLSWAMTADAAYTPATASRFWPLIFTFQSTVAAPAGTASVSR